VVAHRLRICSTNGSCKASLFGTLRPQATVRHEFLREEAPKQPSRVAHVFCHGCALPCIATSTASAIWTGGQHESVEARVVWRCLLLPKRSRRHQASQQCIVVSSCTIWQHSTRCQLPWPGSKVRRSGSAKVICQHWSTVGGCGCRCVCKP